MGPGEYVWDYQYVDHWAAIMEALNVEVGAAESDCRTINRRQEALGMEISEFPDLVKLKNEVKPSV